MIEEFKKFALRGNVIDMAVGVIIGAAFGKIVTSLVNDVVMPPIGMVVGKVDFSDIVVRLSDLPDGPVMRIGAFVNETVNFLIMALVIFMLIRQLNRFFPKPPPTAGPVFKECPHCLSSIPAKAAKCAHCTSDLATV